MKILSDIRIGARLGFGFGVPVLLLCTLGGFALVQASRLHDGTTRLSRESFPKVQVLGNVRALSSLVRKTTLEGLLASEGKDRALQRSRHDDALVKLSAALSTWQKMATLEEEKQLHAQFSSAWTQYLVLDGKANGLTLTTDATSGDIRGQIAADSAVTFSPVAIVLDKAIHWEQDAATAAGQKADDDFDRTIVATVMLIAVALALCTVIAVVTTRSITEPIRRSVKIAQTVAQGDLGSTVAVDGKDEVAQLLGALRDMNLRLRDVVGRVRSGGDHIASASSEVASGTADLSQRTEEQAASLQQTAASMQELTDTVRRNAENVRSGNALAANAFDVAGRAGAIVRDVVETMRDILSSSAKVAEINANIEGIAFQTNILALNAAVEAARAGEQGRGFAVVAGEVRTLAQRCATAARQVKELVDLSATKVNIGSALVHEAGGTMEDVLQAVKGFTGLMTNIATALDEQRAGIEQINIAVNQMGEMTQRNAALVEQSTAATHALATQSDDLRQAVAFFRNIDQAERIMPDDRFIERFA
jgi:methyl-accepting chemotaxis protein